MKTALIILLTLAMPGLFSGCSRKTQQAIHDPVNPDIKSIMERPAGERINFFALDMMKFLSGEEGNYVVSPFSISTALAMTYGGAAGQTAGEMVNTLYLSPDQESFHREYRDYLTSLRELAGDHIQLNIANALWAQQGYHFLPSYFELIEQHYQTRLNQVNFKGDRETIRLNINKWVFDETREKIKDLIAPGILSGETRLVLVNAIHFYGKWMAEFNEELTRKEFFHGIAGQKNETDFMRRTGWYQYAEAPGLQIIDMPYQGGNYSMVVILPGEGADIRGFEKAFGGAEFMRLLEKMERTHVELRLPRFEMETSANLEQLLSEMGMPTAFSLRADFSGMTGDDSLMIDKVIHKAMIDVREAGTEAAAATAVVMVMKTSIEPEPEKTVRFHADRPFLFFIKDNTHQSILFMGRTAKL